MNANDIQQTSPTAPASQAPALDHGILNLPLAKRGNIDAQIDAYKKRQAADARWARRQAARKYEAARKAARALFDAHQEAILGKGMASTGKGRAEVLEAFLGALNAQPGKLLAALTREYGAAA
jgi:hypothetical protein